MSFQIKGDYNKTLRHSLPGTDYVRYIERTLRHCMKTESLPEMT